MKSIFIPIILFSSMSIIAQVHVAPVQTEAIKDALVKAQKVITDYFTTATAHDKYVFSEYLKNYKSVGGYQAVTPPSPEILKAAQDNPTLQTTFNTIKEIAKQFTQTKKDIPGASSLTPEGEAFYAALIHFVNQTLGNR